jgi:hypothetical protein
MRDEGSGMRDGDLRSPFTVPVAQGAVEDEFGHPFIMNRCFTIEAPP